MSPASCRRREPPCRRPRVTQCRRAPAENGPRHPLRHAAARRRFAAGDRRSRRRWAVRAQVSRRRARERSALVAELVSGELARALGLPVPELVFAELDPDLARTEPDPEIHALIRASAGAQPRARLPVRARSCSIRSRTGPTADVASRIVWFDAYVTNVDRTARNPNLLMWHRRLWLIDHGATLYFHHTAGLAGESDAGARTVRADQGSRAARTARRRSPTSTPRWRRH